MIWVQIDVEYVIKWMLHICKMYMQFYDTMSTKTLNKNQVIYGGQINKIVISSHG